MKKTVCLLLAFCLFVSEQTSVFAAEIPASDTSISYEATDTTASETTENLSVDYSSKETLGEADESGSVSDSIDQPSSEIVSNSESIDDSSDAGIDTTVELNSEDATVLTEDSLDVPNDESDFTWDGTVITKYTGTRKNVCVPAKCTGLRDYVFEKNTKIESIDLSHTAISSIPADSFCYCSNLSKVIFPSGLKEIGDNAFYSSNLKELELPDSLETIGSYAFAQTNLFSVDFPADIKSIGFYAFGYTNLTSIDLSNTNIESVNGFSDCKRLASVKLPSTVKVISNYCFSSTAITEIALPESLTEIEKSAFEYSQLTKIDLPDSLETIGESAFNRTKISNVNFPDSIKSIKADAFSETLLSSIDLSNTSLESVNGFSYCDNLTTVKLPSSLKTISSSCFKSCPVTKIVLPESLKEIENYAFASTKLTGITIPSNVSSIGSYAFNKSSLVTFTVLADDVTFGSDVFSDCKNLKSFNFGAHQTSLSYNMFKGSGLESVTLPSSITSIGVNAFDSCTSLTSVDLSACPITTIPKYCFKDCTKLSTIKLPDTLTTLEDSSFLHTGIVSIDLSDFPINSIGSLSFERSSLTEIHLPYSLKYLGSYCFNDCNNLEKVYVGPDTTEFGEEILYSNDEKPGSARFVVLKNSKAHKALVKAKYSKYLILTNTLDLLGCTVTFEAGNGECTLNRFFVPSGKTFADAVVSKTDETPVSSLPTATRTGGAFLGWYNCPQDSDSEYGTQITSDSVVPANTASYTVYAWYTTNTSYVAEPAVIETADCHYVIVNQTPGASIKYCIKKTLDDTTVLSDYSGEFTITEDCYIYAISVKDGIESAPTCLEAKFPVEEEPAKVYTFEKAKIDLKNVTVSLKEEMNTLEDGEIYPRIAYEPNYRPLSSITCTLSDGQIYSLTENVDYTIKFGKEKYFKDLGLNLATVTYTGKGHFKGNLSYKYYISPKEITSDNIAILANPIYTGKKGAYTPAIYEVFDYDENGNKVLLKKDKDYKIQILTEAEETPSKSYVYTCDDNFILRITGIGHYTESADYSYAPVQNYQFYDVAKMTVSEGVAVKSTAGINKPKVTITNTKTGKKLVAGRDYERQLIYMYGEETMVTAKKGKTVSYQVRSAGSIVGKNDIVPVGTSIIVAAYAKGNYLDKEMPESEGNIIYDSFMVGYDISKAAVTVPKQTYTGSAIMPTKADITVKIGGKLIDSSNYEVIGYSNNTKTGTGYIYVLGTENGFGLKKVAFKIVNPPKTKK